MEAEIKGKLYRGRTCAARDAPCQPSLIGMLPDSPEVFSIAYSASRRSPRSDESIVAARMRISVKQDRYPAADWPGRSNKPELTNAYGAAAPLPLPSIEKKLRRDMRVPTAAEA